MQKQNKIQIAKAHGVRLYPFKGCPLPLTFEVPKGAIYGLLNNVRFVCTHFPDDRNGATVRVWTYDFHTYKWHEHTLSRYFDEEIIKCKGCEHYATWNSRVAEIILEILKAIPTLRVEGFKPPLCRANVVRSGVLPYDRKPQKYTPTKELFAQRCVDGKGYKSHDSGVYEGAMKEHFAQGFKEDRYWATR